MTATVSSTADPTDSLASPTRAGDAPIHQTGAFCVCCRKQVPSIDWAAALAEAIDSSVWQLRSGPIVKRSDGMTEDSLPSESSGSASRTLDPQEFTEFTTRQRREVEAAAASEAAAAQLAMKASTIRSQIASAIAASTIGASPSLTPMKVDCNGSAVDTVPQLLTEPLLDRAGDGLIEQLSQGPHGMRALQAFSRHLLAFVLDGVSTAAKRELTCAQLAATNGAVDGEHTPRDTRRRGSDEEAGAVAAPGTYSPQIQRTLLALSRRNPMGAHGESAGESMSQAAGTYHSDSTRSILMQSAVATSHAKIADDEAGFETVNQYVLLEEIGAGSQGRVYLAMDTHAKAMRAIKEICRPQAAYSVRARLETARLRNQVKREIAIMKRCRHRSIVSLYEVIDDPEQDRLFMVMQYVDRGPVTRCIGLNWTTVPPARLLDIARQLTSGLLYLHHKGIAHRDIKPDNILVDSQGNVFLADFGVSAIVDEPNDPRKQPIAAALMQSNNQSSATFASPALTPSMSPASGNLAPSPLAPHDHNAAVGTIAFRAPELFLSFDVSTPLDVPANHEEKATTSSPRHDYFVADIWSLGISFYVMLYGRLPYDLDRPSEFLDQITNQDIDIPKHPDEEDTICSADALMSPLGGIIRRVSVADVGRSNSMDSSAGPPALRANTMTSGGPFIQVDNSLTAEGEADGGANGSPYERSRSLGDTKSEIHLLPHVRRHNSSAGNSATTPRETVDLGAYVMSQWRKILVTMLKRNPKERCSSAELHRLIKRSHRDVERVGDEQFADQKAFLDAFAHGRRRSSAAGDADEDNVLTQLRHHLVHAAGGPSRLAPTEPHTDAAAAASAIASSNQPSPPSGTGYAFVRGKLHL
jgi:serine/threonine protein kinase